MSLFSFLPTRPSRPRAVSPSSHLPLSPSPRLPLSNVFRVFRVSPVSRVFLLLLTATLAPLAHAQWQTPTYNLRGGWNSIYLHGDASHASLDTLFAANPEVLSVWRWIPNPNPAQTGTSTLVPSTTSPEWAVWVRGQPAETTLSQMQGQAAYLIQCSGTPADSYSLTIPQRALPPRASWVRNGANFLGFPTRLNGTYPTFSAYFATFPAAIAANSAIFKYVGGDIGPNNPVQAFSPTAERVDRHQAYWFDATVVGQFYAPLEISTSVAEGLAYGRTGSLVTVRVRNRTAAVVTLTVEPAPSLPAPAGQPAITAAVPLTRRTLSGADYTESPLAGPFNTPIAPQSAIELQFGIDRAQMTGPAGSLYASLLRFTDSGGLLDVNLPVTARTASLAGLWVGDVAVSDVQSFAPGSPGTSTPRSYPLRVLLHVDDAGTARLLSQVFLGQLAPAPHALGLCTRESGLKPDARSSATRLVAVTMPLDTEISTGTGSVALGSTLVRTINVPFNDRTNPFVHAYHPDHDNKDPRGNALPAGKESYTYSRECRFTFSPTPIAGASSLGWGATVLGGTYTEIVRGVHKLPITATGTFTLRRVSEIGAITLN